jgi:hypothetical protein
MPFQSPHVGGESNNRGNKLHYIITYTKNVFESVVAVVFQNIFHSKIYQNNIFLFFKNYF